MNIHILFICILTGCEIQVQVLSQCHAMSNCYFIVMSKTKETSNLMSMTREWRNNVLTTFNPTMRGKETGEPKFCGVPSAEQSILNIVIMKRNLQKHKKIF